MWGLGFRVQSLGFRVQSLGFRGRSLGLGLELRTSGLGGYHRLDNPPQPKPPTSTSKASSDPKNLCKKRP